MVRNIVVLGGNSHPQFVDSVCQYLGIPPSSRVLEKFSGGETRCEIRDSVRGKDVYIVQTFGAGEPGNKVNDHFIELCIMISACKTGSAKRVTAVLPLFPYSRQPDLPYEKAGAPLTKAPAAKTDYTFESVPVTPGPHIPRSAGLTNGVENITDIFVSKGSKPGGGKAGVAASGVNGINGINGVNAVNGINGPIGSYTTHDMENPSWSIAARPKPGYKQWTAQAGSLIADLLTCAGADRVLTCDLHESTYQGFFDIPGLIQDSVDNLYGRPLLKRFITQQLPENSKDAVIVSPDAGGAKRATAIADSLGLNFALIHKERRPTRISDRSKPAMMLVGDVTDKLCILIDDLVDTGNTITRAAKLLKREGATAVWALLTHGILSGDAIERIEASALDLVVVTNTVAQNSHQARCNKLLVLDISPIFAEAIRRVHHGESISVLFQYD